MDCSGKRRDALNGTNRAKEGAQMGIEELGRKGIEILGVDPGRNWIFFASRKWSKRGVGMRGCEY